MKSDYLSNSSNKIKTTFSILIIYHILFSKTPSQMKKGSNNLKDL